MKIITNNFLKNITNNPESSIYEVKNESPEIEIIDKKMQKEFILHLLIAIIEDKGLVNLLKGLDSDKEREVLAELAINQFYYFKSLDKNIRTKLGAQLILCNDFIKTDMCKRNLDLKASVMLEVNKLKMALSSNMVVLTMNKLNNLYINVFPNISIKDRYVKISETMHYLKLFKRKQFLTLAQAEDVFRKKGTKQFAEDAKTIIYDRIKKHIEKDHNNHNISKGK